MPINMFTALKGQGLRDAQKCAAPEGYKMPDEPDGFDGHDYEGFPGGCERMNSKGTPCPSENQSRA
jgi:hypothetical protein